MNAMLAEYGGRRRVAATITGRTIYDSGGGVAADSGEGLPNLVRYNAKGYMVDVSSRASWAVVATNKAPDGGRPTDDVTIKYASVGDSCEIEIADGASRLIVCTEKIVFKTCDEVGGGEPPVPEGLIQLIPQYPDGGGS